MVTASLDMSLPWLKWYFEDWQGDEGLALCGYAARGLWMELLAIMRKADPYGHLLINGRQPSVKELLTLTRSIRHSTREIENLLSELNHHGVYSKTDAGIIVSRRLIRDEQRRLQASQDGSRGGNPTLKGSHKASDNGQDKPHAHAQTDARTRLPEARSQKPEARSESAERAPARRQPVTGSGVMGGMLPRDHMRHSFCGERVCMVDSQFAQFRRDFGGDPDTADARVRAFCEAVDAALVVSGEPIGGDVFDFWRARKRAHFGVTDTNRKPTIDDQNAAAWAEVDAQHAARMVKGGV